MRRLIAVGLGVLVCRGAVADDRPAMLKPGPGSDAAQSDCNVCHTSNYIIMNSPFLTADQWKAEVEKMRKAFGAPIDDATAAAISAYLAANYGVEVKP